MWNPLECCCCCASQTGHHHLISNPLYDYGVHFTLPRAPTQLLPPYCFFPQPTIVGQSNKPTELHTLHNPPHQENLHGVQNFFQYEAATLNQFGIVPTENIVRPSMQHVPFVEYQQSTQQYCPSTMTVENIIPAYQREFAQVVLNNKTPVDKISEAQKAMDEQTSFSSDTTKNEQPKHSLQVANSNVQYINDENEIHPNPTEPNSKEVNNIDLNDEKDIIMESVQINHVQNNQYSQKLEEDVLVPRQNSPPSQTTPSTNQMISLSPTALFMEKNLGISKNILPFHQTIPIQVSPQLFHPQVAQNNYSNNEVIFQSYHSEGIYNNKLVQNYNGCENSSSMRRPFNKSQSLSNSILNKRKNLWLPPKRVLTCGGDLPVDHCFMSFPENINQTSSKSDWSIISKRRNNKSLKGIKRVSFSADNLVVNQRLTINQEIHGRRINEQQIQQEKHKVPPSEPLVEHNFLSTEGCSIENLKSCNKNQKLKSQKSSEIIQVVKNKKIQGNTRNEKKILSHRMKNKQKSTEQNQQKIVGLVKNYSSKSNKTERNRISQQQQQYRQIYNNNKNNSPRQLVLPSLISNGTSNYSTTSYNNEKYKLCRKKSQGLKVCGCNLTLHRPYSDQMGLLPTVDTEPDIAYSSKGPGQDLIKKVLKLREHNRLPMLSPISARKNCFTATTFTNPRPPKCTTATKNYSTAAFVKSIDSINHECGYSSSENSNPNPRIFRRNSKTRTNLCDYRVPSFDSKPIINPMKFRRFQEKIRRLSTPPSTRNSTLKNAYYIYPECES